MDSATSFTYSSIFLRIGEGGREGRTDSETQTILKVYHIYMCYTVQVPCERVFCLQSTCLCMFWATCLHVTHALCLQLPPVTYMYMYKCLTHRITYITCMKDNARQMHTPKAASDFHRRKKK